MWNIYVKWIQDDWKMLLNDTYIFFQGKKNKGKKGFLLSEIPLPPPPPLLKKKPTKWETYH